MRPSTGYDVVRMVFVFGRGCGSAPLGNSSEKKSPMWLVAGGVKELVAEAPAASYMLIWERKFQDP